MNLLYLVLCAVIVAALFKKLGVPGALLVGSLIGSAIYTITFGVETLPTNTKFIAQALTGAFIGASISREEIKEMTKIIKPVCISLSSMLLGMMVSGAVLYFVFNFDVQTALLSAVPGGISDVTLMSIDFNADINTVALIQTTRLFSVLVFLPNIIGRKFPDKRVAEKVMLKEVKRQQGLANAILTLGIGFIGASIGEFLKFPAGALSFAMLFVVVVNYFTNVCYVPKVYRTIAQIASGCLIGSGVTIDTIKGLPDLILPIIVVLTFYLIFNYSISTIITKKTSIDMPTAMFATAPAGAADIVLIASEMNMDVNHSQIVLMQIARLISVVTIFPLVITIILALTS